MSVGARDCRSGSLTKTVLIDNVGPVQIEVPRDLEATFDLVIRGSVTGVRAGSTRSCCSLAAKGLATSEVSAHSEGIDEFLAVRRHHVADHRQVADGDGRVVRAATAAGPRRGVHRRDLRQVP